ncbi:hypothetical protein Z951_27615 [Streptomyces sp. PRh5]|uniref:hypothetical protein n=1 Tax=Streptomyces sp. PRh5 TaxID=1158056 RepID=UPI000452FC6A|nr:hypothetical protein [Streptomyces sp. PRh5]EXU65071.1 hypothetical protein Z951_27615 [Streptomyces sp. PRh5]
MRPSEAAAPTERDCKLPESGWGELILAESRPEVAAGWTDDGKSYEVHGLSGGPGRTRPVPIPPVLMQLLRRHLDEYGTAPDGRLFHAVRDGRVRSTKYTEVWQDARREALPHTDLNSLLAEVP